jgi:hypothetical protein
MSQTCLTLQSILIDIADLAFLPTKKTALAMLAFLADIERRHRAVITHHARFCITTFLLRCEIKQKIELSQKNKKS